MFVLSFLFPIQHFYNKNADFRIYLTYGGQKVNDCGHFELLKDFFSRVKYVKFIENGEFDKLDCPEISWRKKNSAEVEELIKDSRPTQIEFDLTNDEQNIVRGSFFDKPFIFIQLSSNSPQRIWKRGNYEILIRKLLETTEFNIVLSDWANSSGVNITNDRIKTFYGCNLSLAVELVKRCSLLISTCSWNKFVASLESIPRIILCADVSEMMKLSKIETLNHVFRPVIQFPNYKLLGINNERIENGRFVDADIVENVNQISPDEVMREVNNYA